MGFSSGFQWVGGFISQIHLDGLGLGGQVWIPSLDHLGLGLGTWRSELRNTRRFHQPEAKAGWKRSRGQGRGWKRCEFFCHFDFLNHFFCLGSVGFFSVGIHVDYQIDTKPEFALFVGNLLLGVFVADANKSAWINIK